MAVETDENLDDVISDLVDEEADNSEEKSGESPLQKMQAPENVEFEGPPVELTERAAEQVRKIRSDEELEEELRLRVAVEGGGCSGLSYKLGFDYKSEEDEVLISRGIEIIVDPKHMMYLEGISIDYPDGLDARGFTFDNPNASETCGCGSSFAT